MEQDTFVGKFIRGREVVEVSSSDQFVNFYFEDGSYDTAPIVDGEVKVEFDSVVPSVPEAEGQDTITVIKDGEVEEYDGELGFYKTLQPIPYTDQEGNEIGQTEVGSIQEVPVALGDAWVEDGLAEKVEKPESTGLLGAITKAIKKKK